MKKNQKSKLVAFAASEESGKIFLDLKIEAHTLQEAFLGLKSVLEIFDTDDHAVIPPTIEAHKKEAEAEFKKKVEEAQESKKYSIGEEYEGSTITDVYESEKDGAGVLTMLNGLKVKYDLKTGKEIARKGEPLILLAKEESLGAIFRGAQKLMDKELVPHWILQNLDKLDAIKSVPPVRIKERIKRLQEQA